jgi:hypothetical protein
MPGLTVSSGPRFHTHLGPVLGTLVFLCWLVVLFVKLTARFVMWTVLGVVWAATVLPGLVVDARRDRKQRGVSDE